MDCYIWKIKKNNKWYIYDYEQKVLTVLVINTNFKKANNHLPSKLIEHTKKNNDIQMYDVENPGPGTRQAQKYGGINLIDVIPTLPSWILNSYLNEYLIKKNILKPAHTCFHLKRPHAIIKMNGNINLDSTISESMNARS